MTSLPDHPIASPIRRERIHVVHLLHTIAYGGVETILINWFKHLRKNPETRLELSLICFANTDHSEAAFLRAAQNEGISVETIPWSRRKPVLSSGARLARILRERNARILHSHNTYADLTSLIASRLARVKTVSSVYVWSDFGWKRNMLQRLNQWALRSFDGVTAQCRTTLQDTCARGINPNKVRILPSGFDVNSEFFSPSERNDKRRQFGATERDLVLINAARLYPEKAQNKLLISFKRALQSSVPLKLWILGVGPLEQKLKAMTRTLRLEDHVRFLGFRDDLHTVMKLADIQVHPSLAEGIPMSILSGMASALPILASDVGGISEVLTNELSALLVPAAAHPTFEPAFEQALARLTSNQLLREQLGQRAAAFIRDEYSIDAALRNLEQLYRDIL